MPEKKREVKLLRVKTRHKLKFAISVDEKIVSRHRTLRDANRAFENKILQFKTGKPLKRKKRVNKNDLTFGFNFGL